jgi:alpha-amylase
MKIFYWPTTFLLSIFLIGSGLTRAQDNKKIVLQGFWWDFKNNNYPQGWANYLIDLAPRLRRIGVDAVWVPVNQKNANPSSVGYSPFDHYDLGDKFQKNNLKTPFGDKDEFLRLVGIFHRNGIDAIQDIVLNHCDGAGSGSGQGGVDSAGLAFYNSNRPNSNYQDIPVDPTGGFKNFRYVSYVTPASTETRANYLSRNGRWPKNWQNFNPGPGDNRYTGDDLSRIMFGPDLAFYPNSVGLSSISTFNPVQQTDYMRTQARNWMIWFKKQTGVDGFRLDAIKHFPASICEDVIWNVQNNAGFANGTDQMFTVGEWVGGKSELDAWIDAVQGRAGTFDFGMRGFSGTPGLYGMVYGMGNYDLSNLPGTQQDRRYRTVPFVNNHDTFRPTQPAAGSPGLQANGNYPVDANGNPRRWNSNSELSPNIDPREPRLTAAYAIMMSMDGHPSVFFEDLFDVGTTGKRFTHLPTSETDLPVRQSIANLIRCHRKLDFKGGGYRVRSSEASVFFDGSNAQDLIVFERSAKAIIAVTDNFTTNQAAWIDCDFAVGTVLKDYTGNFPDVTVTTRMNGPGGRVRVVAPSCGGTANNTLNKGVAVYGPKSLESFFNQPFVAPNRTTSHEWELADDLGDSNPRSLRQGGALPQNSTETRWAGKIFAEAGKTITYRLFPSFPDRNLTLLLTNSCGVVLDSVKGTGNLVKTFTPNSTNWYQFRAKNSIDTNREQRVWVNVTYTGPDSINALANPSRILPFVELGPDRYGCGSSLTLNAAFGTGITYVWRDSLNNQIGTNPSLSVTQPGRYSVTLTDPISGCSTSDRIRIISFEAPPVPPNVVRVGDTLKITNIVPGVRYTWRVNGVSNPADTLTYLVIPTGATAVNLTSRNQFGCQNVTPNLITSIASLLDDEDRLRIYPNPSKGNLTFEYNGEEGQVSVSFVDMKGAKVAEERISRGESVVKSLDVSHLKPGLYLLQIQIGNQVASKKIVIQP